MMYFINKKMDFIPVDETALAVYNPENGDSYIFDEIGVDIFKSISDGCDLATLLKRLSEIYNIQIEDIQADVEEFIDTTTKKGILILK